MSKTKKIILGIATIWPILYMVFFFLFFFSQIFLSLSKGSSNESPVGFFLISTLHFLTMILMFVLLFVYIKNVFKNKRIAQGKKAWWAIVLFSGSFIAMPIYWYLYVWKEPKSGQLSEQKV